MKMSYQNNMKMTSHINNTSDARTEKQFKKAVKNVCVLNPNDVSAPVA